jgi:DNA mismatch repair protein MutL
MGKIQHDFIGNFERENRLNWEKLYSGIEPEPSEQERPGTERKFFQIKNKYIVCPVKSGLMVIDQKRAHERVLFENFLENMGKNRSTSQIEMFPVTIEINPADVPVLREVEKDLTLMGFKILHSGSNQITVTGIPSDCGSHDPAELLEILLEDYKSSQADPSAGIREKVAASMACASAIPYGKVMMKNEMEDLFDMLFACKAPNYSPRGKPVITILTLDEIDKRFR